MNFVPIIIFNGNSFEMKKDIFKKEIEKLQNLNCRIGRYFTLPDWKGYGKNDSAKVKNVFPADGTRKGYSKILGGIKPLMGELGTAG